MHHALKMGMQVRRMLKANVACPTDKKERHKWAQERCPLGNRAGQAAGQVVHHGVSAWPGWSWTSEGVKLLPQLGAAACSCQQAVSFLQHSLRGCCDMRKLSRCDQDMHKGCMHVRVMQIQMRNGAIVHIIVRAAAPEMRGQLQAARAAAVGVVCPRECVCASGPC